MPNPADHAATFFDERALLLVAFLVERARERGIGTLRCEQELLEWIARWREAAPAKQHFVAVELGIILRALSGPAGFRRLESGDNEQLCWLIARCMSKAPA